MTETEIAPGTAAMFFEENPAKLAEFMGVPFTLAAQPSNGHGREVHPQVLVTHWKTWSERSPAARPVPVAFIYGWDGSPDSNEFLKRLTGGAVARAKTGPRNIHHFSIPSDSSEFSRQLAGTEFDAADGLGGTTFEYSNLPDGARALVLRNGDPYFLHLQAGGTKLFLSGQAEVADLDQPVQPDGSLLAEFGRVAPLMMFLHGIFREQCWTAPARRACFIIDDPLLRRRYGWLDYQELLESMERANFATSIAFIPWNYRRTDPRLAALFLKHPDRYSICVHGCDHSGGEFCGSSKPRLVELIRRGLWRMERHSELSGVPFAPIMVFPQGLFSRCAMEALAESRFLAVVNTSPFPADGPPDCLLLRELLEPAVTRFSNFPIFTRRYPKSVGACMFDQFLGKPLLLVEHHDYFRDGCDAAEKFVSQLNVLDPGLEWTDLESICVQAHLRRIDASGGLHIRFYTDRFSLNGGAGGISSATLYRRVDPDGPAISVSLNGRKIEAQQVGNYLTMSVSVPPGGRAEIVLERQHPAFNEVLRPPGLLYAGKALFRRGASEFRDNFVAKRPWAARLAGRSLKLIRGSK